MGKHHGFQQKGYVNPLAAARSSGGGAPVSRHEGVATITIKEYLARPRPTLDEFKERIAEKEREQQRLDEWEEQSGAAYRRLLARDRKKKLAAAAGKRARSSSSSSSSSSSGSSSGSSSSSSSSSASSDEGKHRHKHRKHRKHRHKEARAEAAAGPWKLSEFFRAATKATAPSSAPVADTPSSSSSTSSSSKRSHSHHHHHRHHHHHHSRSHSRSREKDAAPS